MGARLELISDLAGVHNQVQHLLSILGRELLHMGNQYSHLSSEEHACIMLRLRDGFSSRAIARELRRSPSSVTREIAKHHSLAGCGTLPYEASRSSMRAHMARFKRRRQHKLAPAGRLFAEVRDKLKIGWSPDQISGYLKALFAKAVVGSRGEPDAADAGCHGARAPTHPGGRNA